MDKYNLEEKKIHAKNKLRFVLLHVPTSKLMCKKHAFPYIILFFFGKLTNSYDIYQ